MSYTLPPSVTSLLAAIDAGEYLTPSSREAAIRQAGGPDFVQLALIRQWLAASGGTAWGAITGTPTDQTDLVNYVTSRIVGLLNFKGSTDASANPNYPVALKGDSYLITVAGKIGGASGKVVEVGDMVIADADNAGGTEASVGTSWFVLQANVTGITATGLALIRAANAAEALAVTGGIGGSTGSTDKGLVRASGTGGATVGVSAIIADVDGSGNPTLTNPLLSYGAVITFGGGGIFCGRKDGPKTPVFLGNTGNTNGVCVGSDGTLGFAATGSAGTPAASDTNFTRLSLGIIKAPGLAVSVLNAKVGGTIYDFTSSVASTHTDGTEDDLFTRTLPAGTLAAVGQKLEFVAGLSIVGSATATRKLKVYFGGTAIFDTGAIVFATSGAAELFCTGIVVDATPTACKVRWIITLTSQTATLASYTGYTEVTGLTLTNTQILKITGAAAGTGAAAADITAVLGSIDWKPAA